jgi:hypothetical protein
VESSDAKETSADAVAESSAVLIAPWVLGSLDREQFGLPRLPRWPRIAATEHLKLVCLISRA